MHVASDGHLLCHRFVGHSELWLLLVKTARRRGGGNTRLSRHGAVCKLSVAVQSTLSEAVRQLRGPLGETGGVRTCAVCPCYRLLVVGGISTMFRTGPNASRRGFFFLSTDE
jgi:hypothetical protein